VWKWFLAAFLILVALCGGGGFFFAATDQGREVIKQFKPGEKQTEVRLDAVQRGKLVKVVSAPGSVEPKTKLQVSAQVSAKIIALPFREGDHVKKGDVVCRLDADDYVASLESTKAMLKGDEARLEGLRADLANAQAEWGRSKELYDTKDVSKSDLDTAEMVLLRSKATVSAAEHSIDVAKANITRAQKNLEFCTIISSIDGIITKLNNEVGEQVLGTFNNAGTVIMEIADLSTMLVKAKVDEANIGPVKSGQKAGITINAFPDRTFPGTVELVGLKKQLDRDGTGYFETQILVKQSEGDQLPSGLTANADIEVQTFDEVIRIPSQAVVDRRVDELPRELTDGNPNVDKTKVFARIVYQFLDGKAKAVPVSIGPSDVTHTVILSGLDEGTKIITGPYKVLTTLRDDQKVVDEETAKKERELKSGKKPVVAEKPGANGKS
jgi:HlyD family secretion protein